MPSVSPGQTIVTIGYGKFVPKTASAGSSSSLCDLPHRHLRRQGESLTQTAKTLSLSVKRATLASLQ
jgi:hypothetical protein